MSRHIARDRRGLIYGFAAMSVLCVSLWWALQLEFAQKNLAVAWVLSNGVPWLAGVNLVCCALLFRSARNRAAAVWLAIAVFWFGGQWLNAFEETGSGWPFSYAAALPLVRIDHVFSRGLRPLYARYLRIGATDHRGLYVILRPNPSK